MFLRIAGGSLQENRCGHAHRVAADEGDDLDDPPSFLSPPKIFGGRQGFIPQAVLDRIGPTASPRSSIVISDEPLSAETNYRTEFVAVLSNQPQGGFITRKPTVDVLVANRNGDDFFGFMFQRNPEPQPVVTRQRGGQYYRPRQQGWW